LALLALVLYPFIWLLAAAFPPGGNLTVESVFVVLKTILPCPCGCSAGRR